MSKIKLSSKALNGRYPAHFSICNSKILFTNLPFFFQIIFGLGYPVALQLNSAPPPTTESTSRGCSTKLGIAIIQKQ